MITSKRPVSSSSNILDRVAQSDSTSLSKTPAIETSTVQTSMLESLLLNIIDEPSYSPSNDVRNETSIDPLEALDLLLRSPLKTSAGAKLCNRDDKSGEKTVTTCRRKGIDEYRKEKERKKKELLNQSNRDPESLDSGCSAGGYLQLMEHRNKVLEKGTHRIISGH